MIKNIINKLSVILFCIGICMADSENLLIPILTVVISCIMFKLTDSLE
jgi:hypothetical protein